MSLNDSRTIVISRELLVGDFIKHFHKTLLEYPPSSDKLLLYYRCV